MIVRELLGAWVGLQLVTAPNSASEPVPIETPGGPQAAAPVPNHRPDGRLTGRLTEPGESATPIPAATVELTCTCLDRPVRTTTDIQGAFVVDGLPAGDYALSVDLGAGAVVQRVSLTAGGRVHTFLRAAIPNIDAEIAERERKERSAQAMLSGGAIAAVTGLLLLVGAGVEYNKSDCKFELETCANAPRPQLAKALAVGGAFALVAGATTLGFGAHRLRKLRASVQASTTSAALVLVGRF